MSGFFNALKWLFIIAAVMAVCLGVYMAIYSAIGLPQQTIQTQAEAIQTQAEAIDTLAETVSDQAGTIADLAGEAVSAWKFISFGVGCWGMLIICGLLLAIYKLMDREGR